jgi:hypothetical protein
MLQFLEDEPPLNERIVEEAFKEHWKVMVDEFNNHLAITQQQWGEVENVPEVINDTSKDTVTRHEQAKGENFKLTADSASASSTKGIQSRSVASFKKMAGYDSVLN